MFATQLHVRETTDPNGSTIFATWCPVRVVSDAQTALRGRIRLRSRRVFPDLSDLRLDVHVETREGPSERVRLDALALGPGMEQTIELPNAVLGRLRRPGALALSVTVSTAAKSPWAPVGTEIGVHQVHMARPLRSRRSGGPAEVTAEGSMARTDRPRLILRARPALRTLRLL